MKEVIRKDPKHSSAFNYLGYLYAEAGINLDEAETLIMKALEIKPNDGYYTDSLGWVYYQKKEYDKALETLLRADQLVPEEGIILEHIGDVYRAMSNLVKAKEYYQKALKGKMESTDVPRIEKKVQEVSS
jgi:tetratricopeptide (TPR) repeat protein